MITTTSRLVRVFSFALLAVLVVHLGEVAGFAHEMEHEFAKDQQWHLAPGKNDSLIIVNLAHESNSPADQTSCIDECCGISPATFSALNADVQVSSRARRGDKHNNFYNQHTAVSATAIAHSGLPIPG